MRDSYAIPDQIRILWAVIEARRSVRWRVGIYPGVRWIVFRDHLGIAVHTVTWGQVAEELGIQPMRRRPVAAVDLVRWNESVA